MMVLLAESFLPDERGSSVVSCVMNYPCFLCSAASSAAVLACC